MTKYSVGGYRRMRIYRGSKQIADSVFGRGYTQEQAIKNADEIANKLNLHDELVEALEIAETYKLSQEDRIIIEEALKKAGVL